MTNKTVARKIKEEKRKIIEEKIKEDKIRWIRISRMRMRSDQFF